MEEILSITPEGEITVLPGTILIVPSFGRLVMAPGTEISQCQVVYPETFYQTEFSYGDKG